MMSLFDLGIHVLREEGPGATLYLGRHRGAPYIGLDPRGFSGWTSTPRWMPGGWEFFNPTLYIGRLYMGGRHATPGQVLVPAKLWDFYYWKVRPSGRRYMREHGHDEPQEA